MEEKKESPIAEQYRIYRNAVKQLNEDVEPDFLIVGAIFLFALVFTYVGIFVDFMFGLLLGIMVLDGAIGYPLYKRDQRIDKIEAKLPDILHHMATTLKAGGTIETALRDVSRADYGPITLELRRMLRELKEGKTFENAFLAFADRTESMVVQRSAMVIVSAKLSGGGLVNALMSIADDVRETYRLKRERQARTMLQVAFVVIASSFVAPLIFGMVSGIMLFLGSIGTGTGEPLPIFDTMVLYFKGYLILSAFFSSLAASMIREGKVTKTVIYMPILLLITYIVYWVVSTLAISWLVG
jgi:flagellar protein FlaJ